MKAVLLEDDMVPKEVGEVALYHGVERPPYGKRDELFVVAPCGHLFSLIPEVHTVVGDDEGRLHATPSIVCPNGDYHGFLLHGEWS